MVAQSVTDNDQEGAQREDGRDGVDPDLREEVEDRDRAIGT